MMYSFCNRCGEVRQLEQAPIQAIYHEHEAFLVKLQLIDTYTAHCLIKAGKGFLVDSQSPATLPVEPVVGEKWSTDWDADLAQLLQEGA